MEKIGKVSVGTRWSTMFNRNVPQERLKIRCDCGAELICHFNQNDCNCGERYNMSGQRLRQDAPSI